MRHDRRTIFNIHTSVRFVRSLLVTEPFNSTLAHSVKRARSFCIDSCARELCDSPTAQVKLSEPTSPVNMTPNLSSSCSIITRDTSILQHSRALSGPREIILHRFLCMKAMWLAHTSSKVDRANITYEHDSQLKVRFFEHNS